VAVRDPVLPVVEDPSPPPVGAAPDEPVRPRRKELVGGIHFLDVVVGEGRRAQRSVLRQRVEARLPERTHPAEAVAGLAVDRDHGSARLAGPPERWPRITGRYERE